MRFFPAINRLFQGRLFVHLLTTLVFLAVHKTVISAPMTYTFQATVGEIPPFNGDVSLPFTLEEGSIIDGKFTIDPELGEREHANGFESSQPYSLNLSFDGFSFGAEMYQGSVVNDAAIIPFGGPEIPADFVTLDCSSDLAAAGACTSARIEFPGSEPLALGVRMDFAGDPSILATPALPANTIQWNQFNIWRRLTFIFVTPDIKVDGFDATLSPFKLVPEPSSVCVALTFLSIYIMRR
jgi:hypothetical protein